MVFVIPPLPLFILLLIRSLVLPTRTGVGYVCCHIEAARYRHITYEIITMINMVQSFTVDTQCAVFYRNKR